MDFLVIEVPIISKKNKKTDSKTTMIPVTKFKEYRVKVSVNKSKNNMIPKEKNKKVVC